MKRLIAKLKFLWEVRRELITNKSKFIVEILKKNEKKIKIILYIWLIILNIIFIYVLIKEYNLLKIIIYLIWVILTLFILDTYKELSLAISETNDQRFLIYGIIFFWLNMSCAFFFIWSNIARPVIRYYIMIWKLYEILPWEKEVVFKIINYGFVMEYWELIFILTIFYIKIFLDAYYYDEETKEIDYYKEYKGTIIYKYKDIIDIFNIWKWVIIAFAGLFRILLLNNPFYINDILVILVFIVGFLSVYCFFLKIKFKNKKIK